MTKGQPARNSKPKPRYGQKLADAHRRYLEAEKELGADEHDKVAVTRRLQQSISDIFLAYSRAMARGEDVSFPKDLALVLGEAFGNVAKRHHVELLTPQRGRGRPPTSWSMEECKMVAVRYLRAVHRDWINDPNPDATVRQAFQIAKPTWRQWKKDHPEVSTSDVRVTKSVGGWVRNWVRMALARSGLGDDFDQDHIDRDHVRLACEALTRRKGKILKEQMEFVAEQYLGLSGSYTQAAIRERGAR